MTTLFIDYEGGNDNYGGTSFALLAWGTDGRITSATFSSATASFPNDGSLINHYLTIWNGTIYAAYKITAWVSGTQLTIEAISGGTALANQAVDRQYYIGGRWKTLTTGHTAVRAVPGDDVRLMSSPPPTLVGNATWTGTPELTGLGITSSTNATPIVVTKAGHGLADNDYVLLTGHTTNTNANGIWQITYIDTDTFSLDGSVGNGVGGATGGFRKINNAVVELAAAKTQLIAGCSSQEGAWTASANVTATVNTTDYKNHYGSASIAIGAAFTTGMAAYFPTGTLDLSSYEQVSFLIKQTAGTVMTDGDLSITLCSDAAGATPVDTISVPSPKILNYWMPVTVDTSAALGASIQSCALVVNTDRGAQTFLIGEIIACLPSADADSLSLTSLIGKNTTGETFYCIQSINGTRVVLDNNVNHYPSAYATTLPGYSSLAGTTETVATYKREPIFNAEAATILTVNYSGSISAPISYLGGYDRTSMASRTGETWFRGYGTLDGVSISSKNYVSFDRINVVRYGNGLSLIGSFNCSLSNMSLNSCTTRGAYLASSTNLSIENLTASNSGGVGVSLGDGTNFATVDGLTVQNNITFGLHLQYCNNHKINGLNTINNTSYGVISSYASNNYISGESKWNLKTTSPIYNYGGDLYLDNFTNNETAGPLSLAGHDSHVFSHKHGGTTDDHRIFMYGGTIATDATMAYDATTAYSWKFSPTDSTYRTETHPLNMKLRGIALAANVSKTIGFWMRRSNTGLTMKLVCKGGQLAGIASDVTSSMTAVADTWELVSITLTPTEKGAVELEAHAYGGATYNGWVSKMEVA